MKTINSFLFFVATGLLISCGQHVSVTPPSSLPAPPPVNPAESKPSPPPTADHAIGADFDATVDAAIKTYKVPGIAVGVIHGDQDLLMKGYGFSNIASRSPVSANTLFAIGSMSKAFTSAAAAILVDRGQLSFDDKIKTLLPDFKLKDSDATSNATLRQLLSHQSGLPRHDMVWYSSSLTRKEIYDRIQYLDPTAKLGEKFQYNNIMYLVAGLAVGAKAKTPWETFVQNQIFNPLGMTASSPTPMGLEKLPDVSGAHDYDPASKSIFNIPIKNTFNIAPAGGVHSNVVDLAKWMRFQLGIGGGLNLNPATLAELHKPLVRVKDADPSIPEVGGIEYSMGWMNFQYRGIDIVAHSGSIDGFNSNILLVPSQGVGIVVLQNSRHVDLTNLLTFEILDRLLGVAHQNWIERFDPKLSKALEVPASYAFPAVAPSRDWANYSGSFTNPGYGTLQIVGQQSESRLVLRLNQFYLTAVPYQPEIFVLAGSPPDSPISQIRFEVDANGRTVAVSAVFEPTAPAIRFALVEKTIPLPFMPNLNDAASFRPTDAFRGLLGQ